MLGAASVTVIVESASVMETPGAEITRGCIL
jgi:hypothetical protein